MTIPALQQQAVPVRLPPDVYRSAIRVVEAVGRPLRMDAAATQGVSTEWFTLSTFLDGDAAAAHRFVDYERAEYLVIYGTVLTGWLDDIVAYVLGADWFGAGQHARILDMPRRRLWEDLDGLAELAAASLHRAIDLGDREAFERAQDGLRAAHTSSNDLCVRWIQDLLTAIADAEGEEAVEQVMRVSYERIWKQRYAAWFDLTPQERLALSAEGMRAHYGGPGRRGDFAVEETDDAYVMRFDPCGTGGVLRREVAAGAADHFSDVHGVNRRPAGWSWGLAGIPWYCSHCPMLMEYFPLADYGSPIRPVLYDPDPWAPTRWVVPKRAHAADPDAEQEQR